MENKTNQEILQIKEKLIDLLYWIFAIVMWFGLAISLYRSIELGIQPVNYIQFFLVIVFLVIFLIRKKLPYLIKSYLLLITLYILGTSGVITFGLPSQGIYLLMLFTILTGALLDKKWGIIAFICSISTLIISSVLFLNNIVSINKASTNLSLSISAWLMAIFVFAIITLIIIIFWQRILYFLVKKVEDTLIHEDTLNKVNKLLSKEIDSRKTAEQLLKENYSRTKKLNKEYEEINDQLHNANEQLEISNLLINEAKLKAQTADQLKSSFLSNMSHEIRTPMNAIVGFATLIANEDISPDDKKNYLSIIQSSSNGLLNTISDIITMAKIESGQFILYPKILDLNAFLDEIEVRYTRDIYLQKGDNVKLIFEKNLDKDCHIITDMESLSQIISKLIDNAIKFTENGYIKITTTLPENGYLTFKIQDSGIGIPAETKTEIFETFRQLDHGNTRKYGGTGIGLSISKGLIDLLNGTIEFNSLPGTGATFNFTIPVINQTLNKNIDSLEFELNCKGKTILIIGRYTWDNRELNQLLQEINSVLIYVESGFQAIDTFKEHPEIDLVIMSMFLPDMNSHEVAKIIKKSSQNLPILAHIPIGKISSEQSLSQTGWDDFIESPVDKKHFIDIISRFLSTK